MKTLPYFSLFVLVFSLIPLAFSVPRQKTFIVHVARSEKPWLYTSHHRWYNSILNSLSHPPPKLIYTYEKAINGFSATLTPTQAKKLESLPGILSVLPDETRHLQTTYTYKFLGLSDEAGLWLNSNYGENVIIGVLDTGIWPDRRSFSDAGMSPVPSSWKGKCETSADFPASSCNRKIIGARTFVSGGLSSSSPRDQEGHGTHVASTAAGSAVSNASFYGFAQGEARGTATRARLAIYKVCGSDGCDLSDILAGIEQAISDGVHIISFSVGGGTKPYYRDVVSVAAFGAMQHGILFSAAAGNSGPHDSTANQLAPWALSVGASTVDREFRADVALGDGRTFIGDSLYYGKPLSDGFYPLVNAANLQNFNCDPRVFARGSRIAGKIVVCEDAGDPEAQAEGIRNEKGVGMIVINGDDRREELEAEPHYIFPTTRVSQSSGEEIKKYIRMTTNATANILSLGTVIGPSPLAPKVATFSSRGPNPITPQILKPDLIAPGLNILAAWTGVSSPSSWFSDTRRVEFNVISGTSMACPHVSGLAALLKSIHPKWSISAIKSALMTTSYDLDNSGSPIKDLATGKESTPFVHGAGHVDPNRAADPGLVYDMGVSDYVAFLCSIGYDSKKIKIFTKEDVSCDKIFAAIGARVTPGDLNYPSFSVVFRHENDTFTYQRSVTNIGDRADVIYKVSVNAPKGVEISVSPEELEFDANSTMKTYNITFTSSSGYSKSAKFGSIEWSDKEHRVRSPVALSWENRRPFKITSPSGFVASV